MVWLAFVLCCVVRGIVRRVLRSDRCGVKLFGCVLQFVYSLFQPGSSRDFTMLCFVVCELYSVGY